MMISIVLVFGGHMDKEKIKDWVSFPIPEGCRDICILFDRETAMGYIDKFGATPFYGFESDKEEWLPVKVFIAYGGQAGPGQKHREAHTAYPNTR